MVLFSKWTLLCGVYRPYGLVLCHRLCNRSQHVCYFHVCYCDQSGVAFSLQFCASQLRTTNGMSKSMSRPNIAAPGEAFNTVWYVERIAQTALSINESMSAG